MALTDIFGTLREWAGKAWSFLSGVPGDAGRALDAIWRYTTNSHNVLAWLTGGPELKFAVETLAASAAVRDLARAVRDALHRVAGWTWLTMVAPVQQRLNRRITALAAIMWRLFGYTWTEMERLYNAAIAYASALTAAERAARVKADAAEHAAMMARVKAAVAQIEHEAASGYNSGLNGRLGLVAQLLNDVADRQPEIRGLVSDLVKMVFDLETIDNPVLRFTVGKLLGEVIAKLGVDKLTGELIARLLAPLTGNGKATGVYDVARDVSMRLAALEADWVQFDANGGQQVEDAGKQWAQLSSVAATAGILGFVALAVADPEAWARGVADTAGAAANATLGEVVTLISRA